MIRRTQEEEAAYRTQVTGMIADGCHLVPPYMWDGVVRYMVDRQPVGHFLTALFSNDLLGAFSRADAGNIANMHRWAQFLYCYAPNTSYGSAERVSLWLNQPAPIENPTLATESNADV